MIFEKHLFISYAHVDNKTTPDDPRGWVGRFNEYLESYLSTNIGHDAVIWRDDRLRGNDIFANEIVKQFPKTAAFVAILSRRYLESEWCLREIDEFCRIASENVGLAVEDKVRVLRVMLHPLPAEKREQLPAVLKDALGYEFYYEAEGKHILPLDPSFGNAEAYKRNIYFLAADIAALIEKLEKSGAASTAEKPTPPKPAVYLAECGYDRLEDNDKIRGELKARGYTVLPDQPMPDLETDYVAQVVRLLERCRLSVHLVGARRGKVPNGATEKSAAELQNELAAQMSEGKGLRRVIWLPEGTLSDNAPQQAFIDALLSVPAMQRGADLIAGDLEDLKSAIRATLSAIEDPKGNVPNAADEGPRTIYLICVEQDLEAAAPLMEFLQDRGCAVELPLFTGDAAQTREANEKIAIGCHGVILFFGAGGGAWRWHQQSEMKRIHGLRRERPLLAQLTYLSAPDTADKKVARLKKEPGLVDGLTGFPQAAMEDFVKAVLPGASGTRIP